MVNDSQDGTGKNYKGVCTTLEKSDIPDSKKREVEPR